MAGHHEDPAACHGHSPVDAAGGVPDQPRVRGR
jgi:hypothetical protein